MKQTSSPQWWAPVQIFGLTGNMKSTAPLILLLVDFRAQLAQGRDQSRYQTPMAAHHYLYALPKIRETLLYVATSQHQRATAISMSQTALKCHVRDFWIR